MPTSTSAYSFAAGAVNDSDSVGVIAYSGAGGTGCSNTCNTDNSTPIV